MDGNDNGTGDDDGMGDDDDEEEVVIVVGTSVFQDATWGTCPRYSIAPFSVQDDNDVVEDKRDVVVVDDEEYDAN